MLPRHVSRPLAFVAGGIFALLINKLTWPEPTGDILGFTLSPPGASPKQTDIQGPLPRAVGPDGKTVVGSDTFKYPKLEWVDGDGVISSQKDIVDSCQTRLLVLVMSDARQQWKRDAQRESWAVDVSRYAALGVNKNDFKYVYIVGRLFDQISEKVVEEAHRTRDIIVADTNDYAIDGATSKVLWGLKWALRSCTFTHVLKTMDHAFVNVPLVIKNWLPRMDAGNFYGGNRQSGVSANRDPNQNWYISPEDYPPAKYPIYPVQDYVLSRDVAEGLVKVLNKTLLRVYYDDVGVAYALSLSRPQLVVRHEPNIVHLCTPAVSRPFIVLKVMQAVEMKRFGTDMFNKQIICHLRRKT